MIIMLYIIAAILMTMAVIIFKIVMSQYTIGTTVIKGRKHYVLIKVTKF